MAKASPGLIDYLPRFALSVPVNLMGAYQRLSRYPTSMFEWRDRWRALEHLSLDQQASLKLEALRRVLIAARNTPFYGRRMREAGFDPNRLKDFEDIKQLPPLTREELRAHSAEMINPDFEGIVSEKSSGGTTGDPVKYRLPRTLAFSQGYAMLYQFCSWHGIEAMDRRATLAARYLGRGTNGRYAFNFFENQLVLGVHALNEESIDNYVRALRRAKLRWMQGHPSALLLLAELAKSKGLDLPEIPSIALTGESFTETDRDRLTASFGATVFATYGQGEQTLAGGECEYLDGYHLHPAFGHVEIEHTNWGAGEVIATSLLNDVMPLIRYRTGDLAEAIDPSPCECGRTWPRLRGLQGRSDDTLFDARGRPVLPVALRTALGSKFPSLPAYSIVQYVDGPIACRVFTLEGDQRRFEDVLAYLAGVFGQPIRLERRVPLERLTNRGKHKLVLRSQSTAPYRQEWTE